MQVATRAGQFPACACIGILGEPARLETWSSRVAVVERFGTALPNLACFCATLTDVPVSVFAICRRAVFLKTGATIEAFIAILAQRIRPALRRTARANLVVARGSVCVVALGRGALVLGRHADET
mgnify:CR=1 FL=1